MFLQLLASSLASKDYSILHSFPSVVFYDLTTYEYITIRKGKV